MDTNNTREMEREFNKLSKKELIHFIVWCFSPEAQRAALENVHSRHRNECTECANISDKL